MTSPGPQSQFWRRCLFALSLLLVPISLGASAPTEYDVKLVYLYNFTKFVNWPDSAFADADAPINICVLGSLPAVNSSKLIGDKTSRNRTVALRLLDHAPAQDACHILFFTKSISHAKALNITRTLSTPTTLTKKFFH